MASKASPFNGLLVVDKPGGPSSYHPTSHDIVATVRRWSGQRRIGHTGTLDPMASGVLVLCMGKATRLVEYYQGHHKRYRADIRLGAATDTFDAMGEVTSTAAVGDIDQNELEEIFPSFRDEILQNPPAYSAIKQNGEALHRKARRGEEVQVQPRRVTIHTLTFLEMPDPTTLRVRVECSAGTYIRSLAHDIGMALGTYAHLAALRREAVGAFTLEDAHTLKEIEEAAASAIFDSLLLPLGAGLHMPSISPDPDELKRLGYGQHVILDDELLRHADGEDTAIEVGLFAQARSPEGALAGILRCTDTDTSTDTITEEFGSGRSVWRAAKWLQTD